MSVISEALTALQEGRKTLDEVETLFRQHQWPPREVDPPMTFNDLIAQADADATAAVEGTWVEVETAYVNGIIDHEQYTHLAQVVAEVVEKQRQEDS